MKKFFFLLIFSIFSCEVFAQESVSPSILRGLIEENIDQTSQILLPKFSNRLITDITFDDNYQDTNRKNEYKDADAIIRFFSTYKFNKNISVKSFLRFERFDTASQTTRRNALANGGGDRSFENEGLHIEELAISYDSKKFALIAGKFNPNYGTAWRWNRGIWIREISNNYRQREKLGFGGIYRVGDVKRTGQYEFGFSAFTNDRKNLDNAVFSKRDSDHKSDAKPGDIRSLKSYVASLDVKFDFGENFGSKEKLSYHFAYTNLAVNSNMSAVTSNKIADQKGFVAGLNYEYPLAENFALDALLEFEKTKNLNGDGDISEHYLTSSLITKIYHNWNVTLGYAERDNSHVDQDGFKQNTSEISFGYDFDKTILFDKLTIQAGYKNQRTDNKTNLNVQNVLGVLLRYYKNF